MKKEAAGFVHLSKTDFFSNFSETDSFFQFTEARKKLKNIKFLMIVFFCNVLPFKYILQKWIFFSCYSCFICLFSSSPVIFAFLLFYKIPL